MKDQKLIWSKVSQWLNEFSINEGQMFKVLMDDGIVSAKDKNLEF
jgi:hypothetical protein